MLRIALTGDCQEVMAGTECLVRTKAIAGRDGEITVAVSRLPKEAQVSFSCRGGEMYQIAYQRRADFFYALMLLLENADDSSFSASKPAQFAEMHAMVDVSRNAVYTVREMERFLCRLALCGYTGCLLYMEDTYPLEAYPYFGYMRGQYTKEELMALDACAASLGIELIPCIQTLAHLKMPLRWDCMAAVRDAPDTLLVGEEAAYALIDAMFQTLCGIFTSKRIHIGMDEAKMAGRGKYLALHGLRSQRELMLEHIERVGAIARRYGLRPMIWDDMLYREANDTGMGYFTSGVTLSQAEMARLPKEMEYVYWDYYKADAGEYDPQLEKRKALPTLFAGASWKWNGWVPCYDKSFATGRAALAACRKHGIGEVMLTLWADDGAETPLLASLPSVILYGEGRFEDGPDAVIDRRCELMTGSGLSRFLAIENLELLPDLPRPNLNCINSAKQLLYSDVMQGLFDLHYDDPAIGRHYAACAAELEAMAAAAGEEMRGLLSLYACLARLVAAKAPLGSLLRKAYQGKDRAALLKGAQDVRALIPLAEAFHQAVRVVWCDTCKGSGLEVLDIRLGGLTARCRSVAYRLEAYLSGGLDTLDELERDLLPFGNFWPEGEKYPSFNPYAKIVSANSGI